MRWSRQLGGLRRLAITVPALACAFALLICAPAGAIPQSNDDAASAFVVPALNTEWNQPTADATPDNAADGTCGSVSLTNTVWYRFTGTGGPIILDTSDSDFDTVMVVYQANGNAPGAFVACNDDTATSYYARLSRTFDAGVAYLVKVGGCLHCLSNDGVTETPSTGDLWLTLLANDARANAETLTSGAQLTRTNSAATTEPGAEPLSCKGTSYGRTVWFRFTVDRPGTASLSATEFNGTVTVIPAGSSTPIDCNAGGIPATIGAKLGVHVSAGTYDVQVGSRDAGPSRITVGYDFAADPPPDKDGDGVSPPEDCDDNNAGIKPGLPEVPNNDVDENCDGIKAFDRDGDKHLAPPAGDDCDDNNPNRFPGNFDIPGDGIDQDCANGPAVKILATPRVSRFVKGGSISVNGRPIKFAAKAIQLADLTRGATVKVKVCRHGCHTKRFKATGSRKRLWFAVSHKQVVLTGATVDIRVYFPGKSDVAGSYLLLRLAKAGAKECSGGLQTGGSKVSGKLCRPR